MDEFKELVCTNCFYQDEYYVFNVNGRCDRCGGTDWEVLQVLLKEQIANELYGNPD